MNADDVHPKYSYVYQWRSFSNPANSSYNNAFELGDRMWYMPATRYEHRRAMMEEAQEVKASLKVSKNGKDSLYVGQAALDTIRRNSDLYRQLASRYILIGHSMGGVVSREYVQGNFYNGDVDKIITLDSPHEGTGALNMQLGLLLFCSKIRRKSFKENRV
jgi:triacylglycerol esterase/lipase EstA (alpha/beta hydrolase family)